MNRDAVIIEHLPRINRELNRYLARNPDCAWLRDDLRSAATLEVVREIDRISQAEPPANLPGYLSSVIRRAFGKLADDSNLVGPRSRTARKDRDAMPQQDQGFDLSTIVDDGDRESLADLRDMIDACCETDFERDVVRLRAESKTDDEVAVELQVTKLAVHRARKAVERRFDEQCAALGA